MQRTQVLDRAVEGARFGPPTGSSETSTAHAVARFERRRTRICSEYANLLSDLPALDELGVFEDEGFSNIAEWVSARVGNSVSQAWRWVRAARVMRELRFIPEALRQGELCLDKVLELTRFATPHDEERLLRWAKRSSVTQIRNRADREKRASLE